MQKNNEYSKFDLLYHYNPYNKTWACFSRVDYVNYFNGSKPRLKIGKGSTLDEAINDKLNS